MPKTSCIDHLPSEKFFPIRSDYLALFDDYCAAAVMAVFEYWTNGVLGKMEREQLAGDPWVSTTISRIKEEMLGMYSERAINDALKKAVDSGLLVKGSDGRGFKSLYLLNIEATCKAVRNPAQFRQNCKIAEVHNTLGGTLDYCKNICKSAEDYCKNADEIAVVGPAYKEEEERIKKEECNSPVTPTHQPIEEPTPEPTEEPEDSLELALDTIIGKIHNRFTAMNPGRRTTPLANKFHERIAAEYRAGFDRLYARMQQFVDGGGRSLDEFARGTRGISGEVARSSRARTTPVQSGRHSGTPNTFRKAETQRQTFVAREVIAPEEALEWNRRCPAHAFEVWDSDIDQIWAEATAAMNGKFDKWLDACEKISPLAAANPKYGTGFNLEKALRGWAKVLNGGFKYLANGETKEKPQQYESSIARAIANLRADA